MKYLNTAASRLFNDKTHKFEEEMLEPLLTLMMRMYLSDGARVVKIRSVNDMGVTIFKDVNVKDLSANGKFVATGSSTYTEKARIAQTLLQLSNTQFFSDSLVYNYFDPKELADILVYSTGLDKFSKLIKPNARVDAELDMRKAAEYNQQQLEETQIRGVLNAEQASM